MKKAIACKIKRVWHTREMAQTVADFESAGKPMLDGAERLYVYQCEVCSDYHLTKRAQPGEVAPDATP